MGKTNGFIYLKTNDRYKPTTRSYPEAPYLEDTYKYGDFQHVC